MIIYRKSDKTVVIPCGLGPVICPDSSYELQMKQVDSSTVLQQVEPDSGYYGLYRVIVNPIYDANLLPDNIKNGVEILGVLGTYAGEVLNLQAKSANPSLVEQIITFDASYDGLSSVTIAPVSSDIDPDIQAGNIKRGVEILGVTGTFDGGPLQSKKVDASTVSQTIEPDNGNYGLSSVTVNPYTLESKTQNITVNGTYSIISTSADGLSSVDISVNVADIPAVVQSKSVTYNENGEYTVTSDEGYDGLSSVDISVNIPAEHVELQSKTVDSSTLSQSVTFDQGYDGLSSVTVNPYTLDTKTVDSSTVQQVIASDADGLSSVTVEPYVLDSKAVDPSTSQITVNSSADGLSSVTVNAVTSNIDPDIQAGNIKRGVEILGVTGTFDGGSLGTKTVDSSTISQTITPESSDYGLSSVTVNPYVLDSKTVNSSTAQQVVTSDEDGLSSVTVNPYTLDSKTVDSSTVSQVVTSSEDGLSSVTVNPYTVEANSSTLTTNGTYTFTPTSADALSSVTVDVSINTVNNQSKTVDSSTVSQTIAPDQGYTGLSYVTVNPYTLETAIVNASTSEQVITPSTADGLSSVTVNAAALQNRTVDASTVSLDIQRTSTDYYGLGHVYINPVTAAIDPDIQASNIKRGVEILGVTGTFDGGSLGTKTVNSSTSSQTVTPESSDYGLSSVTVNPYTVEADSSTLTSNGTYVFTPQNADALSSVTVDVSINTVNNQNKTVNPSTNSQSITADYGYTGLGTVTVNPMSLQTKSVTANTTFPATIVPDSGYDGFTQLDIDIQGVDYQINSIQSDSSVSDTSTFDVYAYVNKVEITPVMTDSITIDASINQQVITPTRDAINQVTVNAVNSSIDSNITAENIKNGVTILGITGNYSGAIINNQSKTVDSSTSSQTVAFDSGYTGLSSVTVNPYVLDTKSVNPSTGQITVNSSADGLSSVTVNAVTSSIDQNIQAGNIKNGVTILGVTGTLDSSSNWITDTKKGIITDLVTDTNGLSGYDYGLASLFKDVSTLETAEFTNSSCAEFAFEDIFEGCENLDSVSFPSLTAADKGAFYKAFSYTDVQDASFPNLAVCDFSVDLITTGCFNSAFLNNESITSISFPSLITGSQYTFDHAFEGCTDLASINMPEFTSPISPNSICDCSSLASITAHPLAIGTTWLSSNTYTSTDGTTQSNANSNLTTVTLTYDASDNISFSDCSALSAATVLNILEHLDLTVSGKTCTFYSGILSIDDDEQGTIQLAYNAATAAGWTISNLVIRASSYRFIDYIESTGQTLVLGNNMGSNYFVEAIVQPVYGGSSVSEYNRFIAVEFGAANTGNEWRFAVKSATSPDQSVDNAWYADLATMDPTIKSKILLGCRSDGYFWFVHNNVSNTYYRYNRPYNGSGQYKLCFSSPNNYGKTWGIKIYDNLTVSNYNASTMTTSETPIYSYMPAQRMSDNAYGLLEEISGEFYTVAGLTGGMDQ